jgi:hypothetical protein
VVHRAAGRSTALLGGLPVRGFRAVG